MINKVLTILGFILSICSLVFLFKLRADTKLDTFKQPFETGSKEKFFISQNISSNTTSEFGIKCELYEQAIMNSKVDKLGLIFNLNVAPIHSRTTQLIIIFFLQIAFIFLPIIMLYYFSKKRHFLAVFLIVITLVINYALYIANFVITVLLVLSYFKGDTNRYIDFLSCKNVNKGEFDDYSFAKKLRRDFIVFIILNIVCSFLNYTSSGRNAQETNQQRIQNNKNKEVNEAPAVEMNISK